MQAYEIWQAKNPMAMIMPIAEKATLVQTHQYVGTINANNLEDCFTRGQCSNEWREARSISVGDVIQAQNADFLVLRQGFAYVR
jgi:hypothetical protein